jgi:hypothetical protein
MAVADGIQAAARGRARGGSFRLLHSLDGSIAGKIQELANELGGATALAAAAPFWDSGEAIDDLCLMLELDSVYVHAHPGGTAPGTVGTNWPFEAAVDVIPVAASAFADGSERKLHAKAFEVMCRRGRLLISGSANVTGAALSGRNIEACVARIQRDRLTGWTFDPAAVPAPVEPTKADEDVDAPPVGILRAAVSGDRVTGRVLVPRMRGRANLFRLTSEGPEFLAEVDLDDTGSFAADLLGFEGDALRGGRLVFRAEAGGKAAEGFASLAAATGLRKFAGKAAASLMALLTGSETPEDLRVIMEWAHDNPDMLRTAYRAGAGRAPDAPKQPRPSTIARGDLWKTGNGPNHPGEREDGDPGWTKFVDALFAAFRERRGPIGRDPDPEDDETGEDQKPRTRKKEPPKKPGPLEVFEKVFEAMLPKGAGYESAFRAFDLAAYVCDRLGSAVPYSKADEWLRRIVEAFCVGGVPPERQDTVWSAIMATCGPSPDPVSARLARGRMMMTGGNLEGECPLCEPSEPFLKVLGQKASYEAAWEAVQATRTWREQARAYADALASGAPGEGYEELLSATWTEASELKDAFSSDNARKKVIILSDPQSPCCKRRMQLPAMEAKKLKSYGIARAANCCQKVLVWPEQANG